MNDIIVRSTVRERLEALGGTRREAWVVGGIVIAIVLGAILLWSRGAPSHIAAPATATDAVSSPEQPTATGSLATPATVVLVHVAGAVRRPGLYELSADARVADALRAARGPLRRADVDSLNLAEPVVDGSKVEVPVRGRASSASAPAPVPSASPSVAVVDINVADAAALETIPGVGPVTAAAILEYRAEIGSFTSVDQLLEVSGIGPVTLENLRPYVTI